jgi:hypothetical protein
VNTKKVGGKAGSPQKEIQIEKARVKLSQVNREAKMTLKFLAVELTSELVKNFKNESIKINILKNQQDVNYTVLNRATTKGNIEL